MANNYTYSNTTPLRRMLRKMEHGMYNLKIAQTLTRYSDIGVTYYLLRDGVIITHREWNQQGKPSYHVAGSKEGCQGHWNRIVKHKSLNA